MIHNERGKLVAMRMVIYVGCLCIGYVLGFAQERPAPDDRIVDRLVNYTEGHSVPPEDYVLSKFKDHDVVFLGEWHRIRHDALLVQKLVPLLHAQGVYFLGFEFARRLDQSLIDSLLSSQAYDESLAQLILFRGFVHWGFQEYADILKVAWRINRTRSPQARPFRILALGNSPDWSHVKTPEDRDKIEIKRKVWHGESEEDWAKPLIAEVIDRGQKALVYCGSHHAITRYRLPIVIDGQFVRFDDARLGNVIHDRIGRKAFTILLHAPWVNSSGYGKHTVRPADGYIDAMLSRLDPRLRTFGADVAGTPFDSLPGESSLYKFGYPGFVLQTICDGYICQGTFDTYKGVTPIPGFVNLRNLTVAQTQSPSPYFRSASIGDFEEAAVEDADIKKKLMHLY